MKTLTEQQETIKTNQKIKDQPTKKQVKNTQYNKQTQKQNPKNQQTQKRTNRRQQKHKKQNTNKHKKHTRKIEKISFEVRVFFSYFLNLKI